MPHAVRELAELGLLDELIAQTASAPLSSSCSPGMGSGFGESHAETAAGYRWPQISVHRGELLGILQPNRARTGSVRTRVRTEQPPGKLRSNRAANTWAEFIQAGQAAPPIDRTEADLLVGCDGISLDRSSHALSRRRPAPVEKQRTMWRAVTESSPFLTGRAPWPVASRFDRRVVIYPISRLHEPCKAARLVNWVARITRPLLVNRCPPPGCAWIPLGQRRRNVAPFATFEFPFIGCDRGSIHRAPWSIYQYPMVDRDPLPTWDFGRITLLGDAAHPMYPIGGNGASQAIIDARVLARELATRA